MGEAARGCHPHFRELPVWFYCADAVVGAALGANSAGFKKGLKSSCP
jgi:hypothetical protein